MSSIDLDPRQTDPRRFEPTPEPRRGRLDPIPSARILLLLILVALSILFAAMSPLEASARSAHAAEAHGAKMWNGAEIAWLDYAAARAEAERTGKPIFLQMHATYCGYCRRLARQFAHPAIVALSEHYVMALVDKEVAPEVSAAYAPDGEYVPRSMILDSAGRLVRPLDANSRRYFYALDGTSPQGIGELLVEGRFYFAADAAARAAWPAVWRPN